MGTIGDLERRSGIGPSPAERTAFWQQFHHLDGQACLDAGVAELRRMIAAKEGLAEVIPNRRGRVPKRERLPPLTAEQKNRAPGLCRQTRATLEKYPGQRLDWWRAL